MPDAARPALAGADLDLGYHRTTVVHGAGIALHPGRVTALIGPNGSGKSTLLRALARLHKPTAGRVTLAAGADALALAPRDFARRVTLLAQSRPAPSGVSVRDVVGYGRHPHRGRWRADDPAGAAAVAHAMAVTGVTAMAHRGVDELSGGERQRVWFASCLAQDTGTILLDEPTTYLDLRYQVEVLDLIRDLADAHGVAVGVVLHDLNQAAAVADDVVLMDGGRVRAAGPPAAVLTAAALSETYGITVEVAVDADSGRLTCRPVGRHSSRAAAVARAGERREEKS
ncbi:ABC transporter ATP-binding protein [Pilimelia anulata]|uniref:ABC transporter ATP-binding protein n=1 Tax=Pilimelia anulata TaxID=53371 RepID=A0A8J3BAK2_9ACTN|nr:ABC transporter ATP-binding protein [Pilimelia anulata]GGK00990.1 ABC transporter ATP-binding protein [Pilimelia anulata]